MGRPLRYSRARVAPASVRFIETSLPGVWEIELQTQRDERGWFARTFDRDAFAVRGLCLEVEQANSSFTARAGTLRGMHYQQAPHGEPKLIRCVRGAIFDVGIDLRPDLPTHRQWHGVELSEENARMLFIPPGIAHGFQTLVDGCEVLYQMGARYVPQAARGVRWNDPAFAVRWPTAPDTGRLIATRDQEFPDYVS